MKNKAEPKPTTAAERNQAEQIIRRMMAEMEQDSLCIGFEGEGDLFHLFLWGDSDDEIIVDAQTLDEAYIWARHKVAGTEAPPF